ncbi:MAG: ATP-binding protein [Candidatus Krumholzibacteria bacterium]|nr:ATP-binding protein [Candidatus Krumholzibacteria bacterium]
MIRRGSLMGTFFPPIILTVIVTLVLVTGFSGRALRNFFLERTANELEVLANVTADRFVDLIRTADHDQVQALCTELGDRSGIRITVILADGLVAGDSVEDPALMDNHADRPEIFAALAGQVGRSTRYSPTLDHQRMYVAVAAGDDEARYVLRTSLSLEALSTLVADVYRKIAIAGLILTLLAALTSFMLSRKLSRGLHQLQEGAEAFAAGDLGGRLRVADTTEIARVAEAMNLMAGQLAERFTTIEEQRNESEAVLSSMVEGVLAVDTDENVIGLNHAGGRLLGQDPHAINNRSIQEVGRNSGLTRLAQDVLAGQGPLERDIMLGPISDRWLQVHASGLIGVDGQPIGALLVMNDVTRLRRLENMRRDFVANVSHELKTPITSIKGFVETIIEAPPQDPAEMERFLQIINKQADRLDSIITDLLALSRLEEDADKGGIETHRLPLNSLLERVARDFNNLRPNHAERIDLVCPADLRAAVNAPLLEQALNNLLENALKYSPEDTRITVACGHDEHEVSLAVSDCGPGIAAEHLPRLFERFYRVDKARSRQMGGTGLGLAIVKHIAQAHQGRVEVDSQVGVGSTFTMFLPWQDNPSGEEVS